MVADPDSVNHRALMLRPLIFYFRFVLCFMGLTFYWYWVPFVFCSVYKWGTTSSSYRKHLLYLADLK